MRRWGLAAVVLSTATAGGHLATAALLLVDTPFLALVAALMALNCATCAWHGRSHPGTRAWTLGLSMTVLMLAVHAVLLAEHGTVALPSAHHGAAMAALPALPIVEGLHWLTLASTVAAGVLQAVLVATSLGLGLSGRGPANPREHEQWHRQTSALSDSR